LAPAEPDRKDETKTFSADAEGLAEAAKELAGKRETVAEIKAEDPDRALTPRQAGDQLRAYHERQDAEAAAIRRAMGWDEAEPEVEAKEVTPAPKAPEPQVDTSQAAQTVQHHSHLAQQHAAALENHRYLLARQIGEAFPEVNMADPHSWETSVRELAQYDPARATEFVATVHAAEQQLASFQQAALGQQALAQQAVQAWAAEQDRQFAAAHPEITDAARPALAKAAFEVLREAGLSDEAIMSNWHNGALRTVEAQNMVLMAAKHKLAQQALQQAPRPKAPPVVRPGKGAASDRVRGEQAALKRLEASGSIRDAAKVLGLRRGR
jgi:hypothetical protein